MVKAQVELPALKHQISDDWHYDTDHGSIGHWHTCKNCEDIFGLEHHAEDAGVVTKAPTATTPGLKTFPCTLCGWARTEAVPATGGPVDPGPDPGPSPGPGPGVTTPAEPQKYAITLPEDLTGGTVTADLEAAEAGSEVTLTAEPQEGFRLSLLSAADTKGKELELTEQNNGKYTFTMPASEVNVSAVFEKLPKEKKELPFTDVKVNAWYYAAVDQMYQEGLMGGTTQTTFSPSTPASRAMLVTILYRLEGEPTITDPTSFPDVKAKWSAPAIAWAAEHEIVLGYADGNFGPNDEITREQVAVILFRYAQYKGWDTTARGDLSQYSDSGKVHKYAREAMEWAVGTGLTGGRTQDWLAPRETTTRAELAVMLVRWNSSVV